MPCNDCHKDKSAEWATAAIEGWHGPARKGFQKYADAFHASWTAQADAAALLAAVASDGNTPGFARASALSELWGRVSPANINLARTGLADADPMVRIGALDMLDGALSISFGLSCRRFCPIPFAACASGLPRCSLRFRPQASPLPTAKNSSGPQRSLSQRSASMPIGRKRAPRWVTSSHGAGFRPMPKLNTSPRFVYAPAAINLADLYRQLGRDVEGESTLRTAIVASPRDAGLHYALGLTLTRLKQPNEALAEFRLAVELAPDRARYAYVYAVALHSAGLHDEAMSVLKESLATYPNDRDTLTALINFSA
jgi:tetratricopeptide (TPR) repeat protein